MSKTSPTKSSDGNQHCNQSNYSSASSDSDVERRIKTKATKFIRAFPKNNISERKNSARKSEFEKNLNCHSSGDVVKSYLKPASSKSCSGEVFTKQLTSRCFSTDTSSSGSVKDERSISSSISKYHQHLLLPECLKFVSKATNTKQEQRKCSHSNYVASSSEINTQKSFKNASNYHKYTSDITKTLKAKSVSKTRHSTYDSPLKPVRPFRTYPEDPLTVTIGFDTARVSYNEGQPENYNKFRERMLGNQHYSPGINRNMRRVHIQTEKPDSSYKEKRKMNNLASKRSRDARRAKEDELAVRCAYLEQENMYLKRKVKGLQKEIEKLRKSKIIHIY